jgi:hypothetical protein
MVFILLLAQRFTEKAKMRSHYRQGRGIVKPFSHSVLCPRVAEGVTQRKPLDNIVERDIIFVVQALENPIIVQGQRQRQKTLKGKVCQRLNCYPVFKGGLLCRHMSSSVKNAKSVLPLLFQFRNMKKAKNDVQNVKAQG